MIKSEEIIKDCQELTEVTAMYLLSNIKEAVVMANVQDADDWLMMYSKHISLIKWADENKTYADLSKKTANIVTKATGRQLCSNCQKVIINSKYNFCPNCGGKFYDN